MRRFVSNAIASNLRKAETPTHSARRTPRGSLRAAKGAAIAALVGLAALGASTRAEAQEIQLTGPLAGAPAVRKLRLHRQGRFEIAPGVSFSLLDQYQRTILFGARATYHITDWFGIGVWGGGGIQSSTGLTDELQQKGVDDRGCAANPSAKSCRLTAVNLTRPGKNADGSDRKGTLSGDQMGKMSWVIAPQLEFIPFRGKLALFSQWFVDTDVNLFIGPAFVGLQERADCGAASTNPGVKCADSFQLASRVAVAPTFGLGLNFYPSSFVGFGVQWRGLPFSWNTSGFDNHGGGKNQDFPDNSVSSADREFHFNSLVTLNVSIQLPTAIKTTE